MNKPTDAVGGQIETIPDNRDDTLVWYGKMKRIASSGTYWTSLLKEQIDSDDTPLAFVSDIRYDEYEKDELYWAQNVMDGVLVHVSRYEINSGVKEYIQPPNEDEARNDPNIQAKADFRFEWETTMLPNGNIDYHAMYDALQNFYDTSGILNRIKIPTNI
jgi:hypothetical protein